MNLRWFAFATTLAWTPTALADGPAKTDEEEAPDLVPFPSDNLSGHFQAALYASYALPFGSLSDEYSRLDRSRSGGLFGMDVNYGVDRFVTLGLFGEFGYYRPAETCSGCQPSSLGGGLQVGYHVAQGLRIDPWISYGVGYRRLHVTETNVTYQSVEWLRLTVGADWYMTSGFALTPFALFGAATTVDTPSGERPGATDLRFQFGIKFLLDVPGR